MSVAPSTAAGSPGPFDRNTPSGFRARTSAAGVDAGTTSTGPSPDRWRRIVALDPEVVGDDAKGALAFDAVALVRGHRRHEVDAIGAGLGRGRGGQFGDRCRPERAGHGAGAADVPCQSPRIDPGDPRNSGAPQERVERLVGSPVARPARQLAHHDAPAERTPALVVVGADPVVADVGVGEGDDLAGVGRVGDDLLVARQHRVEHDLAGGDPARRLRPDRLALERRAVGEDERRRVFVRRAFVCVPPARCSFCVPPARRVIGGPHRRRRRARRNTVWRTRPVRVRPAYGVLRLRPRGPRRIDRPHCGGVDDTEVGGAALGDGPTVLGEPAMAAGCHDNNANTRSIGRSSSARSR